MICFIEKTTGLSGGSESNEEEIDSDKESDDKLKVYKDGWYFFAFSLIFYIIHYFIITIIFFF